MTQKRYKVIGSESEAGNYVRLELTDVLGDKHELIVPYQGLINHELGQGYIQDNFPNLTAGQRELFLTGIPESKWNEIFPEDE